VNGSSLSIRVSDPGGSATVGDLSALDLIRVEAPKIRIVRREGGEVLRANGRVVSDSGVDFVASQIEFVFDPQSDPTGSSTLQRAQVGSGRNARFGIDDPANAPSFMKDFQVLALQFNLLQGPRDSEGSPLVTPVVDGVPDGISRTDISHIFPEAPLRPPIAVPAVYRVSNSERLEQIGVRLQPADAAELRGRARGAAVYDDLDSLRAGRGKWVSVSGDRLDAVEVERAAELYDRTFGSDGSRAPEVRQALQVALDDYRRSTGARRVVGFELRRYIFNRPSSQFEAHQALQALDSLFRHHRRSGLAPAEYGVIQQQWLERIQPEGITRRELGELIHPSRYVRGSDVLDVFGD
jgi:hypothetical protein